MAFNHGRFQRPAHTDLKFKLAFQYLDGHYQRAKEIIDAFTAMNPQWMCNLYPAVEFQRLSIRLMMTLASDECSRMRPRLVHMDRFKFTQEELDTIASELSGLATIDPNLRLRLYQVQGNEIAYELKPRSYEPFDKEARLQHQEQKV